MFFSHYLHRYIAPENIPVQYGDLYTEGDSMFETCDSVTEVNVKGTSEEIIEIHATEVYPFYAVFTHFYSKDTSILGTLLHTSQHLIYSPWLI
jgi:hypothetical protein